MNTLLLVITILLAIFSIAMFIKCKKAQTVKKAAMGECTEMHRLLNKVQKDYTETSALLSQRTKQNETLHTDLNKQLHAL